MADNQILVKLSADISNLQTGLNQAKAGLQQFGQAGNTVMGQLTALAGTLGVALATSQMIDNFKSWETGLIDIGTQLGSLREGELPAFAEGIKNMSASSGTAFQTLSKGMQDIVDRGIEVGNELEALDRINRLSITTNSGYEQALNAVDIVMKQFGASAGDMAQVTDKVFEITRQGTLDMGEFATIMRRLGVVAKGIGVDFNDLGAGVAFLTEKQVNSRIILQTLTSSMQLLSSLTAEQKGLLQQEGIALDENTIKTKGYFGALQELMKASEEVKAQLIPSIQQREALSLITNNLAEVEAKRTAIIQSAGVVDEEYRKRQESLGQATKQLQASFNILMIEVLEPLVPIIKNLVTWTTEVIKSTREWAQENPQLFNALVKVVAIVGTVITVGSSLIITLNALSGAFTALSVASVATFTKIVGALETFYIQMLYVGDGITKVVTLMKGLTIVTGGAMLLAVSALALEIGILVKALYDWWQAEKRLQEAETAMAGIVRQNNENVMKQMDELTNKYQDLTDVELERIEAVKQESKELDNLIAKVMEDKKITEEEQVLLQEAIVNLKEHSNAVEGYVTNREHQVVVGGQVLDIEGQLAEMEAQSQERMKATAILEKTKEIQIQALVEKYIELAKQYDAGTISQEAFRAGLEGIVNQGTQVTGTMDAIVNAVKTANESDLSISVKVRLEALDVLQNMKERLLVAQEDLVLAHASGEERKRLQIEITERRALRALENELEALNLKTQSALKLMEVEANEDIKWAKVRAKEKGMAEAEYIAYRKALLEADTAKQKAVYAEQLGVLAEMKKVIKDNADMERNEMSGRIDKNKDLNEEYKKRLDLLDKEKEKIDAVNNAPTGSPQPPNLPSAPSGGGGGGGGAPSYTMLTSGVREYSSMPKFGEVPMGVPYRVKGYAEGTRYVPMTGLYQLHKGEAVLTEAENKLGGAQPTVTVVTLIDPKIIPEVMAQYPNAILNVVNSDILRNGITRRNIKSVAK